jgi:hypothetical protein
MFATWWFVTLFVTQYLQVPDDVELRHRHIAGLAMVTKDQLLTRLPVKKKQYITNTAGDHHTSMASLLMSAANNTRRSDSTSFGEYVSTWLKSSAAAAGGSGMFRRTNSSVGDAILGRSLSWRSEGSGEASGSPDKDDGTMTARRRDSWRTSIVDSTEFDSIVLPRTLGELFPSKTNPIVISIPDPSAASSASSAVTPKSRAKSFFGGAVPSAHVDTRSKMFTVSINVIAARGLNVKESVSAVES